MYRAIIALVLAALTIWSVLWFVSQRTYRDSLLALAANLQDSGLTVGLSDLRIRGYPNRLDATIEDIFIADPAKGNEWRAPFLKLMMLSYSTDHIIAAWPEQQELRIAGRLHPVGSDGLKASLETGGRNSEIERFVVESNRLAVDGLPFTIESMLLALRQREESPGSYEFSLTAELPEATAIAGTRNSVSDSGRQRGTLSGHGHRLRPTAQRLHLCGRRRKDPETSCQAGQFGLAFALAAG